MSTPTTVLDARFSDPGASATRWEDAVQALTDAQLFWITTVRADGRPHVSPLVAVWLDDQIHFCTGPEEQKAHNLRTDPHVILTTGCNQWNRGLDVVVEGDAVRTTDEATLQRLAGAWRTKWEGQWQYEVHDGMFRSRSDAGGAADAIDALVFSVSPTKILAFGKGEFTQTRHVFQEPNVS